MQQLKTAALERELIAACGRPLAALGLRPTVLQNSTDLQATGLQSTLRPAELRPDSHSALEAAHAFFLASVASILFWSALIFTISRWR
jgi:hypothetical protein